MFGETLKSHLNREIGKQTSRELKREVDFDRPDVVFVYNMIKDEINIQINPAFIYGRYRKLVRGIPQSRWDCNECNGRGCSECDNTGRRYPDSISEYIGIPAQRIMEGSRFKVHAAGREDVDVLMLGSGRPFVVEVSEPKIRTPNLKEIKFAIDQDASGKIEVDELEITNRDRAQKIKSEASENVKEYMAQVKIEEEISEKELRDAERALSGVMIEQRTPNRVSHRRSDLVREKQIIEVKLTRMNDDTLEAFFKVQGGTYIKELISGDEGRTSPSLTSVLGKQCICIELNVVAIYSHSPHHNA
jgi:tRNA pseudouridine synthase 10